MKSQNVNEVQQKKITRGCFNEVELRHNLNDNPFEYCFNKLQCGYFNLIYYVSRYNIISCPFHCDPRKVFSNLLTIIKNL